MTPSPPPEPDDGWIEWDGGKCPLPADTPVQLRFRDGSQSVEQPGATAGYWDQYGESYWHHCADDPERDIIAYRVVSK